MEWALYDPETGYYRQDSNLVLGRTGDYFTASQIQPAFGELVAALLPQQPVLELGPGRGEMAHALAHFGYRSIAPGESLPASFTGTVLANEFFDALPVSAGIEQQGALHELLVRYEGGTYHRHTGGLLDPESTAYVRRYLPNLPANGRFEISKRAIAWVGKIAACLTRGTVLIIDYGWSGSEYLRFPQGTLMSYRRHQADANVLADPGHRDITAHVPFDVLVSAARSHGFTVVRFETLSAFLIRALERTSQVLATRAGQAQVKLLLAGMGETFRVLTLSKTPEEHSSAKSRTK